MKKQNGAKKHSGKLKYVALALLILIVVFIGLIGYITDFLWFKELGYLGVFFKKLFTQLKIGIPTFVIITLLAYLYFKFIKKGYYKKVIANELDESKRINLISWIMAAVFGGIVTFFTVKNLWFNWLQFANSTEFGYDDPIFGLDVSFYVFKLDFLHQLNSLIITVLAVFLVLTFIYYGLLMSQNNKKNYSSQGGASSFEEYDRFNQEAQRDYENPYSEGGFSNQFKGTPFEKMAKTFTAKKSNQKTTFDNDTVKELFTIASKQIIIAGVLLFVMLGIHFVLKQFELLYTHNGTVYGAGYTDVNVTLWVYRVLAVLSVIGALSVIIGVKKHKIKLIAVVPVAMIVVSLVGTGIGIGVQNLVVSPNEIAKESKYLERNIEFTQKAYGLDNVTTKPFAANNKLTNEDIKNNSETISNIRINDYTPAEKFYNQTQSIRQYYAFKDVDVDRYMVNGEYTQTFLSAREIDEEKISQTWLNKHLKYTHGYGITLSRVDEVTPNGQPEMLIDNIPPESDAKEIDIKRPEIYFGELTDKYAIVGADEDEFDYPNGDSNKYTRYEGTAGIKLNPFNRLAFAIREQSLKLLVSSNIDSKSRIIINRNISDRVEKIMPYLQYDKDPYIITDNGRLYWMIDAYTSSTHFPYSEPYDVANNKTNYIRNSVKVVIDAYNGDVDYYVVDEKDPIAMTFKKTYPTLFKSIDKMPEGIKSHMRYPSELFATQAKVYSRYHMNDVRVFYQNEDLWDVAKEIYGTEEQSMEPNYYIMNLPGEKKAEFVSSIPFTPKDKKNMTGLMIARNDGENYGELVLYKLPKSKVVYGPRQIEAQIDQHTEISKEFSLWNSSGSTYSRGNMFVIPIEESLLYVEPVYLEASESSIPEVKRVIVAYGDKIAYEKTLGEALESLFGEGATSTSPSSGVKPGGKKDEDKISNKDLIDKANEAYSNAINAQKNGDWAKYGEYMDNLEDYLKKLK